MPNPDSVKSSYISGGGINTRQQAQPEIVIEVLDMDDNEEPIREEELRARFLSFEPLFDANGNLAARELVLKGGLCASGGNSSLAKMNEDMLLTGLYSLIQDGLTGEIPLLVHVRPEVLLSDIPEQLNHPKLVWLTSSLSEPVLDRAHALHQAGFQICLDVDQSVEPANAEIPAWPFLWFSANAPFPAVRPTGQVIVEDVSHADTLPLWPNGTWFKGSFFTGESQTGQISRALERRLELLAIAMRQPLEALTQFFRLNPDMEPRLLKIVNSAAGGLTRPVESAAHAFIMLGRRHAQRVAILLGLAGTQPTVSSRLYAKTAFSRALFMGKIIRLHASSENAAVAFEIGMLSTACLALDLPADMLIRRLGLGAASAQALSGQFTEGNTLLRLVHACEQNDADELLAHSRTLGIALSDISTAYLDAVIAGEQLEPALS